MKKGIWFLFYVAIIFVVLIAVRRGYEQSVSPATYSGVFPCVDCAGIDVTLTLTKDKRYLLTRRYPNQEIVKQGKWSVSWFAPIIELSGTSEQFFMRGAKQLELLDHNYTPMPNAAQYQLFRKESP